jgi:hypothetical protein
LDGFAGSDGSMGQQQDQRDNLYEALHTPLRFSYQQHADYNEWWAHPLCKLGRKDRHQRQMDNTKKRHRLRVLVVQKRWR